MRLWGALQFSLVCYLLITSAVMDSTVLQAVSPIGTCASQTFQIEDGLFAAILEKCIQSSMQLVKLIVKAMLFLDFSV